MLLFEDPSQVLLPMPVYLVALVALLCLQAFRHKDTPLGRARYVLAAALVWAYGFTTPVIANAVIGYLEDRHRPPAALTADGRPLIVVLSTGYAHRDGAVYTMRLDSAGWERTHAGVRLWEQIGGVLLFTGQPAPDGSDSVAAVMARFARSLGVPPESMLVETGSLNTYENLVFTRDIIARHREAWLVTSALHMPRAMAVASTLGVSLRPYPCDYRAIRPMGWRAWLPNNGGPAMFTEVLHELVGLGYYRLLGRADWPDVERTRPDR